MRTQESFSLTKTAKEIAVAIDTDGDRIGGTLNEQNPLPVIEGEPTFDYRKHFQSLRMHLGKATDEVAEAEDEHAARLIRVARRMSERDEVGKKAYDLTIIERQGLECLYPEGSFELAFLKGHTPRVPDRLLEQLVQTVKLLKQPAVEPREPKSSSISIDLDKVVENLEPLIPELRDAVGRHAQANKEAEGSLVLKRKAINQLRRTVVWVGRTTEGLFYLAGEDELAKRIRKSTRRPLRPSEQPEEASPSEAESEQSEASSSEESEASQAASTTA